MTWKSNKARQKPINSLDFISKPNIPNHSIGIEAKQTHTKHYCGTPKNPHENAMHLSSVSTLNKCGRTIVN